VSTGSDNAFRVEFHHFVVGVYDTETCRKLCPRRLLPVLHSYVKLTRRGDARCYFVLLKATQAFHLAVSSVSDNNHAVEGPKI